MSPDGKNTDGTVPLGKPGSPSLCLVRRFPGATRGQENLTEHLTVLPAEPRAPRPYGWELIVHRLTGLDAHDGCTGWDCWPVAPTVDHRSTLACWNFIQSGLPLHHYDQIALFLPAEAVAALRHAYAHTSRRTADSSSLPDSLHFLRRGGDLRESLYLEAATAEALFLSLHPLDRIWPLDSKIESAEPVETKPLSAMTPRVFSEKLSLPPELRRFPPAEGFVLWLDALSTAVQKASCAAAPAKIAESGTVGDATYSVPPDLLVPLLNQRVLFVSSVSAFHHCLRQMTSGLSLPNEQETGRAGISDTEAAEPSGEPTAVQPNPSPVRSLRAARVNRDQGKTRPFTVSRPTNRSQSELSAFPPALLHRFLNRARAEPAGNPDSLLAQTLQELMHSCCVNYEKWTQVSVQPTQLATTFRYLKKWLSVQSGNNPGHSRFGALLPRSFDLLVAARSCIDGNFSFELARLLENTEQTTSTGFLPEIELRLSDLYPDTLSLRLESFATFEHFRQSLRPPRLRGLQNRTRRSVVDSAAAASSEEDFADLSWLNDESRRHCSFPDEDIFLDEAVAAIQSNVKARVRENATQIHELTTSLEDGLDLRETLRNWHKGAIMVRAQTPAALRKVGGVVFVFDDSSSDSERGSEQKMYPWKTLWHAEPHDATHLMFFATDFREHVIGPGIAVSEFGGFAALPAERWVVDLWDHPYLRSVAHSDAELLLLAAGFASPEGVVVHIAPRAPREEIRALLNRNRRPVVHIPLGEIERNKIRKLKTFHILADASVRHYAHKHIRKDHL